MTVHVRSGRLTPASMEARAVAAESLVSHRRRLLTLHESMSWAEMSRRCGVSRSSLSRFARDRTFEPSLVTKLRITKLLKEASDE